jgi:F0F1-type ATP synthase assembly protein I
MPGFSFYSKIGRLSSIILILPSSMAAGWLAGYFIVDRYLGIYPWGSLSFILLGAGAGFYEILRLLETNQRKKRDRP